MVVSGYPYHITEAIVRSMDVFHSEVDRREDLGMLGDEIARNGLLVLVWCPWNSRRFTRFQGNPSSLKTLVPHFV